MKDPRSFTNTKETSTNGLTSRLYKCLINKCIIVLNIAFLLMFSNYSWSQANEFDPFQGITSVEQARAKGFEVIKITPHADLHSPIRHQLATPIDFNKKFTRYIRVWMEGHGILSLAEVEVIGQITGENLAFGKPTRQVNISHNGFPSRAVDGNTSGVYWDKTVTHTRAMQNPWWEVDLGTPSFIESITIYNRTDCCSERLQNIYLVLTDGIPEQNREIASLPGAATSFDQITSIEDARSQGMKVYKVDVNEDSGFPSEIVLPEETPARFMRIWMQGHGILSLAEVQAIEHHSSRNIAQGKPAKQVNISHNGFPSRAVDGNTSGIYWDRTVTHTRPTQNPWWEVDLGSTRFLSKVRIYNRTDCCSERLTQNELYLVLSGNALSPTELRAFWQRDENMARHNTSEFISRTLDHEEADAKWQLVVRRGNVIRISDTRDLVNNMIKVKNLSTPNHHTFTWAVHEDQVNLPQDMPIGLYEVTEPLMLAGSQIIVLFNPYLSTTPEYYKPSGEEEETGVESNFWIRSDKAGQTSLKLGNDGKLQVSFQRYPLDFYEPVVFRNMLKLLSKGADLQVESSHPIEYLKTPWLVLRSFTWLFHDDDKDHRGVAHGSWGAEGKTCPYGMDSKYCRGLGHLYTVKGWIENWEQNKQNAVWVGQCYDFAALFTAASRLFGMACRMVQSKLVGQDEAHSDRVIDLRENSNSNVDEQGNSTEVIRTKGNNAIWEYHVWVEVFLNSSRLSRSPEWYIADPTPSIVARVPGGVHQAGPIPSSRIKQFNVTYPADTALEHEIAYFISMTKGFVWLGKKDTRKSSSMYKHAEAILPPCLLDTTSRGYDLNFQQWAMDNFQPAELACFLSTSRILQGSEGTNFAGSASFGHIYTQAASCPDDYMNQRIGANQTALGGITNFPVDSPMAQKCLLHTTDLYKDSFDEAPFDLQRSDVPDFVRKYKEQSCVSCESGHR